MTAPDGSWSVTFTSTLLACSRSSALPFLSTSTIVIGGIDVQTSDDTIATPLPAATRFAAAPTIAYGVSERPKTNPSCEYCKKVGGIVTFSTAGCVHTTADVFRNFTDVALNTTVPLRSTDRHSANLLATNPKPRMVIATAVDSGAKPTSPRLVRDVCSVAESGR